MPSLACFYGGLADSPIVRIVYTAPDARREPVSFALPIFELRITGTGIASIHTDSNGNVTMQADA
jgi:hypothetical protein